VKIFGNRERLPAELAGRLDKLLDRADRVVSWADGPAGATHVVASIRGLWWPEPDGPRLIGWQSITKAVWRDDVLTVTEADVLDDLLLIDRAPVQLALSVPRGLPPTVRKRVEANIAHTEQVAIGSGLARLVARRVPGADGLRWWARLEGVPDTAEVRQAVRARLDLLRAEQQARLRA
jgi:hypothetical protein